MNAMNIREKIDHPTEYRKLPRYKQKAIQRFIRNEIAPHVIKSYRGVSSYAIKHRFEETEHGFYITNGVMKGAMQAAGFEAKEERAKNWEYALSVKAMQNKKHTGGMTL